MGNSVEKSIESFLLEKTISYQVILPDDYQDSEKFYPVLYLLHGLFGSYKNWTELTDLKTYAADCKFIIVSFDAGDSWYTDSHSDKNEKTETFFFEEFMPAIENQYRILREKTARAIAGLSMGGYGSLKFAFKRPDLFTSVYSMSGAFDAPRQCDHYQGAGWENMGSSISRVFGPAGSKTRMENDLFEIISHLDEPLIPLLPMIYLDCGTRDDFLEVNRELTFALKIKGIEFQYSEIDGCHDWDYWNKQIKHILNIVSDKFNYID